MKANDGVPFEIDDVVAGVDEEKKEVGGVAVVDAGVAEKNVDGAPAVVVAVLADGVEKRKKRGSWIRRCCRCGGRRNARKCKIG